MKNKASTQVRTDHAWGRGRRPNRWIRRRGRAAFLRILWQWWGVHWWRRWCSSWAESCWSPPPSPSPQPSPRLSPDPEIDERGVKDGLYLTRQLFHAPSLSTVCCPALLCASIGSPLMYICDRKRVWITSFTHSKLTFALVTRRDLTR